MRDFARFLFTGDDLSNLTVSAVDDVGSDAVPDVPAAAHGSLKLSLRMQGPSPAQVRPLLPGSMRFIADPAAQGILPDASAVDFTSTAYAGWKTVGTLRVRVDKIDKKVREALATLAPELPVPNVLWYGPLQIPEGFLFDTIRNKLKKARLLSATGQLILPGRAGTDTDRKWAQHAIAQFLAGNHEVNIALGNEPTSDDSIKGIMPTVYVPPGGDVTLYITTALAQNPQDADDREFNTFTTLSRDDPHHPRNGLIPARKVYRELRSRMVPDPPSESLRDTILAEWPAAPRFLRIVFTRTSEQNPSCSVHFPRHTVRITTGAAVLHEQPLPAHGVVYLRQGPADPSPAPPVVDISLTGGDMTWLIGGGTSWREKGRREPVALDFSVNLAPHLATRLPMSRAIFADLAYERPIHGQALSCTYHSIRRTVRALIDNRIAGGRLNHRASVTSPITARIIQRAFAGTAATAGLVTNNRPPQDGDPKLSVSLIPILEAFFPGDSEQQDIPGISSDPIVFSRGRMLHDLWQSRVDEFQDPRQRANFQDALIGRGGAGALVEMGLATFHVDPVRVPGEEDHVYFDRIVGLMLAGLQPGSALQFWNLSSDFDDIKSRAVPLRPNPDPPPPRKISTASYGHSPIFASYVSDDPMQLSGIQIIDQHGNNPQFVLGSAASKSRKLTWEGIPQQIWIAANWDE